MRSEVSNEFPQVNRVSLFGLPLNVGINEQDVLDHFVSARCLLTYLNPLAWSIAQKDPTYVSSLERFDVVVCDGIGVQAAVKTVFNCVTPILTPDFYGMGQAYLGFASQRGLSLSLVGADEDTAERAATALRSRFPGLGRVSSFSGYGRGPQAAQEMILACGTDMVLVGMGMARQERFLLDLSDSGWRGLGVCVGGFFDKLAKPDLQYPAWTEKTRLRFLGRLIREPRRLAKRYFIDYQPFVKLYLSHRIFGNRF